MKENKIEAIRKSASVTAKVLNVIRIICIVATCIALVGGIVCLCTQNVAEGSVIYDGGSFRVLSPVGDVNSVIAKGEGFDIINRLHIENLMVWAALNCFAAAICVGAVTVLITLLHRMFAELRDSDTPFTESIHKRLMIVGILVTAFVFLESVGIAAIVGLSFWSLYCVFGYGMELQKNEDETL